MATEKELLTSRLILRAILPVVKVLLEDDPGIKAKFEGVDATVLEAVAHLGEAGALTRLQVAAS